MDQSILEHYQERGGSLAGFNLSSEIAVSLYDNVHVRAQMQVCLLVVLLIFLNDLIPNIVSVL